MPPKTNTPEPRSDDEPVTKQQLSQLANAAGPLTVIDPSEASSMIVNRILAAETLDEILSLHETGDAKGLLDQPLLFTGVEFHASTFDGAGSPVYGVVRYHTYNPVAGEITNEREQVMTTGGSNVMAQLINIKNRGLFPFPAKLITKRTSNDFDVLWLANV